MIKSMFYSIPHIHVCVLIVGKGNTILVIILHTCHLKNAVFNCLSFCLMLPISVEAWNDRQTDFFLKLYQKGFLHFQEKHLVRTQNFAHAKKISFSWINLNQSGPSILIWFYFDYICNIVFNFNISRYFFLWYRWCPGDI